LLQRELRFEESELASALGPSDVYAADGPVHLGAVTELAGAHPRPELDYPPLAARDPFPANRGVFDALDSGDVLVHHPYDGFAESFERFIAEAADDPADTARLYTDLGLFTADEEITADLHALFNELTGSSRAPRAAFRRLLVAPTNMLDRFLALIAREAEHARAGRGGRIRAKLNGLAD